VTFDGATGPIFFKRITAGEKASLMQGQRVQAKQGEKSTYEIDLGQNAKTKQMMVWYSVCNADGSRAFKKQDEVKDADSLLIDALYHHASEVNKEPDADEEAPGEA
jgi:hypothetical protein